MYQWRNYPWTNFNELNLDWIMRLLKEIQVDAIPALDEKINNVYDYIKDNLSDIVSSLAEVVIDVTLHGVVGDGATDNSAALENVLNMGNIFFFPAGVYRFKDVTVNKPVMIFGVGDDSILQPIPYSGLSDQYPNMFIFNDSVYMSDMQFKGPEHVVGETGTKYYIKSIVKAERSPHVHLERITFDKIYEAYHIGWANPVYVPFEDREGMAFTAHSCGEVCLNDCHVVDFGGEELLWICTDRDSFGYGNVKITNCLIEKTSYANGSAIGVWGGKIEFTNNFINQFNACYDNPPTQSGTILNLCGAYTICNDNIFKDCQGGNYIDFSEGYFTKAEYVKCSGNFFSGNMHSQMNVFTRRLDFSDNYVEGPEILRIRGTSVPFTYHAGDGDHVLDPYCADPATVFTAYEEYSIHGNTCVVNAPLYTLTPASYDAPFSMQHTSGGQWTADKYNFYGNTVKFNLDAVPYNVIYFLERVKYAIVENNSFINAGLSYPSMTVFNERARCIISGSGGCDKLIVNNNLIDTTEDPSCCTIITGGDETFKPGTNVVTVFNRGEGTFTYNGDDYPQVRDTRVKGTGTAYASREYDYNSNITKVTT